ncbi:MAG: hypothetical protein H7256_09560 [Bdellovibrio sp.]|nr:hypothetical protein [Bdellovibrio sp.]
MRLLLINLILGTCFTAWGHIPVLALPIKGTPMTSYFIGQADISRAIYSELTLAQDYFVVQFFVKSKQENSFEILTPVCQQVPIYEEFQPSVLILKGDLPWKNNAETNADYLVRLEKMSLGKVESSYKPGERPQFYEEFGKQNYWVGGKLRLKLKAGLYALVVFNNSSAKGNFTLGINEKESFTPDIYKYVAEVLPKISAGICDPKGFSGSVVQ